ncbi:unnamed protein product [Protopolystoma xenopodis]|uniref:Uncharacterized protein n=1 Tax=Protopolystoma xenopodis TaxID=117903 RepID=A0A448X443_9PLAT|nr:unnamed protein product [Protopolystoma xenopodis]
MQITPVLDCSEAFYKECCLENLNDRSSDNQILHILSRQAHLKDSLFGTSHCYDSETSENHSSSEESVSAPMPSFRGIDLTQDFDPEVVWNMLSLNERREFIRHANSGAISAYIEIWSPWWIDSTCITDTDQSLPQAKSLETLMPSGKRPNSSVALNICETVMIYAFICRYFNGDHFDLVNEAADALIKLSTCLSRSDQPVSTQPQSASSVGLFGFPRTDNCGISQIISGLHFRLMINNFKPTPSLIVLLLADLYKISSSLDKIRKAVDDSFKIILKGFPKQKTRGLLLASRKLEFWRACCSQSSLTWLDDQLYSLRPAIAIEMRLRDCDLSHLDSELDDSILKTAS